MNWGVVGLFIGSLALGLAVGACWSYGTTFVSRYTPALLAFTYYAAQFIYPHPAVQYAAARKVYPAGDQLRLMLYGIASLVTIVTLIEVVIRYRSNNQKLLQKLGHHREGEG